MQLRPRALFNVCRAQRPVIIRPVAMSAASQVPTCSHTSSNKPLQSFQLLVQVSCGFAGPKSGARMQLTRAVCGRTLPGM